MRYLKTSEAATLLNVTPATLRAWESRFAFPTPQRSAGNQRMYLYAEVLALRQTLRGCVSTASAVHLARETLTARGSSLIAALAGYDRRRADVAMETELGSQSLQRCVEGLLLPTLEKIARERTLDSAAWAFAAQWGADWLRRASRLVTARSRSLSIVLGDASRDQLDPDAPHIRALELFSMRAGADIMSLSVRGVAGLGDALEARCPNLIVVAGRHVADEAIAGWAQSVRAAVGPTPIALYRRGNQLAQMPTTGTTVLPTRASDAYHRLVELAQPTRATANPPTYPAPGDSNLAMIQQPADSHSRRHDHYGQAEGAHGGRRQNRHAG
jgi:MerR family transcriptional regulator, light-induced transcriptional regulator